MKFYPSDWRADPALRSCTIAARGLWIEMLCIMHEAEPYGSLLINSQRVDKKRLASLCGITEKECVVLLLELEGFGVFEREEGGTIYSRRMRRDAQKAAIDRTNGKLGGNPKVKGGVNPPVKGEVKAQIPEARSQKEETRGDALSCSDPSAFHDFWSAWPNRVGKPAALKAFNAALKRGASPGDIHNGIQNYVREKPPDRPWLNPATFLNQNRWEDQPAQVTNGPQKSSIIQAADDLRRKLASFDGPAGGIDELRGEQGAAPPRLLSHG